MLRRDFLRNLTMTAAGVLVADDVLELLVEPRRMYWPGADFGVVKQLYYQSDSLQKMWRRVQGKVAISWSEMADPMSWGVTEIAVPKG